MARNKKKEKEYWKVVKLAARDKRGRIYTDSLPKEFQKLKENITKKYKRRNNRARLSNLDPKVYLHKYYPWSYRDYVPTLHLQGFYSVDYAKKRYLRMYGPDALKHVKFILGKDALEKEFAIGKNVYINGQWICPRGKFTIPRDVRKRNSVKSYKEKLKKELNGRKRDSKLKEKLLITASDRYNYADNVTSTHYKPEVRTRIQKVRKINETRKKDLYEE